MVAGKSILEMLWEKLDSRLEQLMADGEPHPDGLPNYGRAEFAEWGRQQGRCEELAFAIALMTNPYEPDLPAIKEEAMRRWESANEMAAEDSATPELTPDRPKRTGSRSTDGSPKAAGRTGGAKRTPRAARGPEPAADR